MRAAMRAAMSMVSLALIMIYDTHIDHRLLLLMLRRVMEMLLSLLVLPLLPGGGCIRHSHVY